MSGPISITPDELNRLRAFQRQVEWLRNSKLFSTGKVSFEFTTRFSFATQQMTREFKGYDETHFLAVLPVMRQFILKNEPVNLLKIHNILMQHCDRKELREWVKHARRQWKETLNGLPSGSLMFFNKTDSVEDAIERLFYGFGGLFHVNLKEPEDDEQTKVLLNAALQKAFPKLWNSVHNCDSVIHMWLDDTSIEVPPCPES